MPFPPQFLEELEARNPIEDVVGSYVTLTRRGNNLFGLCPFHNEKTASFSVAPEKGMYYCFGCHKGGGVVNFIMEIESLDYPDAVRFLAKRAGITVPEDEEQQSNYRKKQRLWELLKDAARYYHGVLKSPAGQAGLKYLRERGLSDETIVRFGLGFAPEGWDNLTKAMRQKGYTGEELKAAGLARSKVYTNTHPDGSTFQQERWYDYFRNRVMFPIIDVRGNVIGFGGRVMDGSEPKYLNSPESDVFNKRKNLFALNLSKKTKMGMLVLTEGYMDTISMHQYGFDCAVASLGTALTSEQAGILAKYTKDMVLCYDGDQAGQNAAKRAIGILEKTGINVRVLRMQDAKDPDEYLRRFGAERFRRLLGASEDQAAYQLGAIRAKYDLATDDGRVDFLREAAGFIADMSSPVEREVYAGRVAETANVSAEAVKNEVAQAVRRKQFARKKQEQRKNLNPVEEAMPASRTIRYDNVRSALAEEGILRQLLLEPAQLEGCGSLEPGDFSVELFGRVFAWMRQRQEQGLSFSISAMNGSFSAEEISHISRISSKEGETVNEAVLRDCVRRVSQESAKRSGDLMAIIRRKQSQMDQQ